MVHFNYNKRVNELLKNKTYILTDFDHALTTHDSKSISKLFRTNDNLDIVLDDSDIFFRDDVFEFLSNMYKLNIPVIIISKYYPSYVLKFLEINNALFPNIQIEVDESFKNKINLNKTGIYFSARSDSFSDFKELDLYRVGFFNQNKHDFIDFHSKFNFTLDGNSSYQDVAKILIKDYNKNLN